MRPEDLAALLGSCLTRDRDRGSETSALPGPRYTRNRRPPCDGLERLLAEAEMGRHFLEDSFRVVTLSRLYL